MSKKQFFIIDGNSFIHRSFNALPPLTNNDGFPTNAITGTINMINGIMKKFKPEKIVVAFDAKGKNFRHELYKEYKATRKPMEDDLRVQIEPIHEIIKAWGLPVMCSPGVEADDSMCSLGRIAEAAGYEVVLATSDKDMRQCVSESILILDTKDIDKNSVPFGRDGVFEKSGVYPENIIDLLALMGDKADNIPGVDGCGEKTAIKWLAEYGDVQGVIENAESIKGKIGEKLRASIDNLKMSYELVVIDQNVDVGIDIEKCEINTDEDLLFKLATKYQLNRFKKDLNLKNSDAVEIEMDITKDKDDVEGFLNNDALSQENLYFEVVQDEDGAVCLIMNPENERVYLFRGHNHVSFLNKLINKNIMNDNFNIIGNNVKESLKYIYKITNNRSVFFMSIKDTRIMHYVSKGGSSKLIPISTLNEIYSDLNLSELRDTFKLDDKTPKWEKMSVKEKIIVKSEELLLAKRIFDKELYSSSSLALEYKLTPVLAYMESVGAFIDTDLLENYGKILDTKIEDLKSSIFGIAGQDFNINSPKQVAEILFDVLAIESKKRSTAEDVLIKLSQDNPIVNLILEYRSLSKLKSTYIEGLNSRVDSEDRVHTTFNQTITTTGRLSSADPNLQNMPIKTPEGKQIRKAFIGVSGYEMLALDYSQIELRILAHLANEKKFIDAFQNNKDIHTITASEMFGVPEEEVTPEQRRHAKAINFGLIYGMGPKKLAEEIGVKVAVAKSYYANYFDKYPAIKPYFEKELELAKENLYVETLNGRKIPTKDINSNNSFVKSHAELAAKNARIQGTAAEIIKMAMVEVFDSMSKDEIDHVNMTIQVHDELVFEVPEDMIDIFALKIKNIMENVVNLKVPLVVEWNSGANWLEAH